jgi:hypothetical protein
VLWLTRNQEIRGGRASILVGGFSFAKRLENVCGTPAQADTNQPNPFLGVFVLFLLTTEN